MHPLIPMALEQGTFPPELDVPLHYWEWDVRTYHHTQIEAIRAERLYRERHPDALTRIYWRPKHKRWIVEGCAHAGRDHRN